MMKIEQVIKTIRTLLPSSGSVTKEQIANAIDSALLIPIYSEINRDYLIREIESLYNIRIDDFRVIEADERRKPWLNEIKATTSWKFWDRYRDYLQVENNFPDTVISQVDKLTDKILDGLFNPNEKIILSKKGLVVGQVQSGKTSNYTGLICKAADAGYKLIIVLAGIHNNLRSQTQLRLDEGFLGFDTQHQRAFNQNGVAIGVGKLNKKGIAHSLTSSVDKGDFTAGAANSMGINFNTSEPIIAVVKKNSHVLRRLHTWLDAQTEMLSDGRKVIRNKSLLLIDDEADHASINTSKENDRATTINLRIKEILSLFDKSGYVGYTATPFANIFIPLDEDDLFPRDFIISLPAPSNYIGPEKIFGLRVFEDDDDETKSSLPIVNRVNDYQDFIRDKHKKSDPLPDSLPESLKTAIKCFILTCTIRRVRGQVKVHNSMLVHVSRYTNWQNHIKTMVENTFDFYRRGIEMKIPSIIEELRKTFEEDYEYDNEYKGETITESYKSYKTVSQYILDNMLNVDSRVEVHEWGELLPELYPAAAKIKVREINGGSGESLDYYTERENGLSVIAIGGDKLSRGLTLEGLSVSYYLRASKMYDTLMQMGRWFGYRPGYVDLCRLFTSRELNEWFCHITLASEELRNEFNYMSEVAGSTPEQYALRVRTHPGVLQISASNKIRRAVNVQVSWSGRLVESYQLQKTASVITSNLNVTKDLINSLSNPTNEWKGTNHILWKDLSIEVLKPFFQQFKVSDNLKRVEPLKLLDYIEKANKDGELVNWNIAIFNKRSAEFNYHINSNNGIDKIGCVIRRNDKDKDDTIHLNIRKNHIISPRDEFFDLSEEDFNRALQRTKDLNKEYKNDFPKGEIVRNEFRNSSTALLLIYFINPIEAGIAKGKEPIVGFAVSFPRSRFNHSVSYAVNEQLIHLFDTEDDLNDFEDDED